jgi:hypothetical protein
MKKLLLTGVAALSVLYTSGVHASEPLKWQCGNVGVTVTYKPTDDDRWFSGDTEYTLTGVEKANNRFKWTNDGLYLNGRVCWPVTPITCLRPDGTSEPCESRQVPLPKARPADAPEPVPLPKTVLYFEPGGVLHEHIRRWQALAASGDDVEIRGWCGSACTLIMAYVPRERICFGEAASLGFHLARKVTAEAKDPYGVGDMETSRWMLNQYPQDIRTWIKNKGGFEWMSIGDNLTLDAVELWAMGYRKCEPDELPVPMRILRSSSSSPKTNQVTNFAKTDRTIHEELLWRKRDEKAEEAWRRWNAEKAARGE